MRLGKFGICFSSSPYDLCLEVWWGYKLLLDARLYKPFRRHSCYSSLINLDKEFNNLDELMEKWRSELLESNPLYERLTKNMKGDKNV